MLIQEPPVDYLYIGTAGTFICKAGPGRLVRIAFTQTTTFTAILYDGSAATGKTIGSISIAAADKQVGQFEFGCSFYQFLTVVTTGAPFITVIFR